MEAAQDNSKKILYGLLEKIIFNEKDFSGLKEAINQFSLGQMESKILRKKIINSRIRILEELLDIIPFYMNQAGKNQSIEEFANSREFEELKRLHNVVIMVSIEGDETLTETRRGKGVYEKVINTLLYLKKYKIISGISITINKLNFRYWMEERIIDNLMSKGIRFITFLEYVPTCNDTELMLTPEERKSFRKKVLEYRRTKRLIILHQEFI